jgi:hypothetical protein
VDWLAWKLAWLGGGQSPQPATGQAQGAAEEYELNNVLNTFITHHFIFLPNKLINYSDSNREVISNEGLTCTCNFLAEIRFKQ